MIIVTVMSGKVMQVKADTTNVSFSLSISIASGTTPPESYAVDYQVVDSTGANVDGENFSGHITSSASTPISLNSIDTTYGIKFMVQSAGLSVRLDGQEVTGWEDKTVPLADVNGKNYNFELFQGQTGPGGGGGSSNYEVTFTDYTSVSGNNITYNVGGTTVTVAVSGGAVSNEKIQIPFGSEGDVTFALTNFDSDTMEVQIYVQDGFSATLTVENGSTSLLKRNNSGGLPDSFNFRVVQKSSSGGGGNPPAGTGNEDITLNISGSDLNGKLEEIVFNGTHYFYSSSSSAINVKGNASSGTNKLEIVPSVGVAKVVSATIGGQTYYPEEGEEALVINALPAAASYDISITLGVSDIVTIIWSYEANPPIPGTRVEHGKVEIVSITRGASTIYNSTTPSENVQIDENGGWVSIKKGDSVVLKVIPDYGYQLKSAVINDQTMVPQTEVSTFKLNNIQGNLHFSGVFEKTSDTISENSEIVKDIPTIANGGNAAKSGTLSMTVTDNSGYSNAEQVPGKVGEDYKATVGSVDISLNNLVSKGTGESWTTPVTDFTNSITVGLKLDASGLEDGETYDIVRDHNGTLTVLNAKYNITTGTLTFQTNQFSTYTIVKKTGTPETSGSGSGSGSGSTPGGSTTPDEGTTGEDNKKPDDSKPADSEQGKIENATAASDNTCKTELDETPEKLAEKVQLTEEEKERVAKGENVKIYLDVKDAAESVTPEDKTLVENAKGKAVVGMYLDINLFKKIGNDTPTKVSETNGAVTISLNMPVELINTDSKVTRTYNIVRVHEGVTTILDCKFDAATNKLSFETNAFSTYALVYTDTVNEAEKTGDMSIPAFWFGLAALTGAGALYIGRKPKKLAE